MNLNLILLTASLALTSQAQSDSKYVVANAYDASGCEGEVSSISNIDTDKCYYALEECGRNPNLKPECDFLQQQSFSTNISFVATCKGGKISAVAFNGKGCDNPGTAISNGTVLQIPAATCLLNFKLACSDNPNYQLPSSAASNVIPGIAIGLLSLMLI